MHYAIFSWSKLSVFNVAQNTSMELYVPRLDRNFTRTVLLCFRYDQFMDFIAISYSSCPCDKQETGDRFCQSHQLFIQDMVTTKRTCAWNIYFSVSGSHDSMMVTVEDDYCVNPCYNELCENLLDDSFEIEFSTTTCDDLESSIDSIDLNFIRVYFRTS